MQGQAIASLVLGVLAVAIGVLSLLFPVIAGAGVFIGVSAGIAGFTLGLVALLRVQSWVSLVGLVFSVLSFLVAILVVIALFLAGLSCLGDPAGTCG